MNPDTELEVKFPASHVTLLAFQKWAQKKGPTKYTHAVGGDTFFADGKSVVRFRRKTTPEGNSPPVLTYKRRKAPGDIRDRIEFDVFVDEKMTSERATLGFLDALGFKQHFTILKESFIYHFEGALESGSFEAVIAVYDVFREEGHSGCRYLEIEIDKHGTCSEIDAQVLLQEMIEEARTTFNLGAPLNASLYELWAPKDELYIPESF